MPNYCDTRVGFICDEANKDELKKLYNVFYDLYKKYGYGDYIPLTEILLVHGLECNITPCDGNICYVGDYTDSDIYFRISAITDWKPAPELWDTVIKQYTGLRYVYMAENQGGGIFVNTDLENVCFREKYVIYASISSSSYDELPAEYFTGNITSQELLDETHRFSSFKELQDFMTELTGKTFETIKRMNYYLHDAMAVYDEYNGSSDDSIIEINEYAPEYKEE